MAKSLRDGEGEKANASSSPTNPTPSKDGEDAIGENFASQSENREGDSSFEVSEVEADSGNRGGGETRMEPPGEDIEAELEQLSRGPFKRILKDFLGFSPTTKAIQQFANKSPDKWAKAVEIIAQLGGYKKDVQETNNVYVVHHMPDSDLRKKMAELEAKLNTSHNMLPTASNLDPTRILREPSPSSDNNIIDVAAKVKQ